MFRLVFPLFKIYMCIGFGLVCIRQSACMKIKVHIHVTEENICVAMFVFNFAFVNNGF